MTFTSFTGKRRALIPPSVGYVNENLKPIPDEVLPSFNYLKFRFPVDFFFPSVWFALSIIASEVNWYHYVYGYLLQFGPRRSLLSHANEPLIFEVQLLKVLWVHLDILIQVLVQINLFVALIKLLWTSTLLTPWLESGDKSVIEVKIVIHSYRRCVFCNYCYCKCLYTSVVPRTE